MRKLDAEEAMLANCALANVIMILHQGDQQYQVVNESIRQELARFADAWTGMRTNCEYGSSPDEYLIGTLKG